MTNSVLRKFNRDYTFGTDFSCHFLFVILVKVLAFIVVYTVKSGKKGARAQTLHCSGLFAAAPK